ncbi:hypothetical protein AYK26_04080 [Euryarchaeota archaeon SM23-78]|nr:MAG: hypothetical protein AYK26_04080 [Euryarchaeota archaeon SM23-78]MBW3000961.1 hypothetical protein [Candidatus Woesearchaeota archaeon]
MTKMQYSNLLKGFIQELDDCYVLMKKKQEDNKIEVEYIFKDLQDKKLGSIKEVIEDIQNLIEERKNLKEEIFEDLEKISIKINNFLTGKQDDLKPEELVEIKRKIVEIDEAKAQEKLNAWRDVSALKKELREYIREFKEKRDGMNVLESMIE